ILRALEKNPDARFSSAREFGDALLEPASPPATISVRHRGRWVALALLVAVIVTGFMMTRNDRIGAVASTPPSSTIRSIAVLPLANHSGDSTQDYFAEGMTDELTTAIATISAIRVTSRGSAMQFQGKSRPSTPDI